jgi:hypothetical protein
MNTERLTELVRLWREEARQLEVLARHALGAAERDTRSEVRDKLTRIAKEHRLAAGGFIYCADQLERECGK